MSQLNGDGSNSDALLALTFAAVAQCPDIPSSLAQNAQGWTVAWQPTQAINGNLAYIAYNGSSQYVVTIRGSIISFSWDAFDNWFEQDFNVLIQEDWQYPASDAEPKISRGARNGLNDLSQLQDENGVDMLTFLMDNAVASGTSIGVVGHSLGGNLATVLAPWLVFQIQQQNQPVPELFPIYTFAAPTAGNAAFASAYDATFANSYRYYNEADIVPKASMPLAITSLGLLYSPAPEAVSISVTFDGKSVNLAEAFAGVAAVIGASEVGNGRSFYTQTNQTRGSVALNTGLNLLPVTQGSLLSEWFEQAAAQHETPAYFGCLGGQAVTCASSR